MSDTKGQKNAWDALREENERLKTENLLWQEGHTLLKMDYSNAIAALDEASGALEQVRRMVNLPGITLTEVRLRMEYASGGTLARAALNERVTKP